MKNRWNVATLLLLLSLTASAQSHVFDKESNRKILEEAAKTGRTLETKVEVAANVSVESVVIPFDVASRVFGKEVASKHIVVQLSISNNSPSAAFVLHSAYIDFSKVGQTPPPSVAAILGIAGNGRAGSSTGRIASVEGRVARGQLLDAQQTSGRNLTMRVLTALGSVAAGYSFSFSEVGIAKGIAAFNGNVIPGVAAAWPDLTVAQLNRISDFGYFTNKLVPKQAGDIVVCFFPIANFLTPGFQKVFQKAPAALFSPLQLLSDKNGHIRKLVSENLDMDNGRLDGVRKIQPCFQLLASSLQSQGAEGTPPPTRPKSERQLILEKEATNVVTTVVNKCLEQFKSAPDAVTDLLFLQSLSFENIQVKIDGVMTVDTRQVPGRIDVLEFDGDDKSAGFWVEPGSRGGRIKGEYLTGATIRLVEAAALGIVEIASGAADSSDRELKFSFKTTKPIPAGTKLTVLVDKKYKPDDKTDATTTSTKYEYVVGYVRTGPVVQKVSQDGATVTLAGVNFFDTPDHPLKVRLAPPLASADATLMTLKQRTDTSIVFDVPEQMAPGCWQIHVATGDMAALPIDTQARKLPESKLGSFTRTGTTLTVAGDAFLDTARCGVPLRFRARVASGDAVELQPKAPLQLRSATFDIPEPLANVPWQLELWQGAAERKPALAIPASPAAVKPQ